MEGSADGYSYACVFVCFPCAQSCAAPVQKFRGKGEVNREPGNISGCVPHGLVSLDAIPEAPCSVHQHTSTVHSGARKLFSVCSCCSGSNIAIILASRCTLSTCPPVNTFNIQASSVPGCVLFLYFITCGGFLKIRSFLC